MHETDADDQYIDQHILAARAGIARVSDSVNHDRLEEAVALFRQTRAEHIQPIAEDLSLQLVENYAQVGRQLARRLGADTEPGAVVAAEVWDAVARAYDWLAARTSTSAMYRVFADDARLQARELLVTPTPSLRSSR